MAPRQVGLFFLISIPALPAQPALGPRIVAAINETTGTARANWGIEVVRLDTGAPLYRRNADRYFLPASNTKLYSTGLALIRLGPDYRFRTVAGTESSIDNGRIDGDLLLRGGGDPTMSWRSYPYVRGPHTDQQPPLEAIDQLAAAIAGRGIRRIEGSVVGDDSRWPYVPFPEGWAVDDSIWEYGAPVSALTINDNAIRLTIEPGAEPGDLARLAFHPPLEYYWVDNRVRTVEGDRRLDVFRSPGSRQIRLTGRISPRSSGRVELLAMDDPAHYAAYTLHEALTRRGIAIGGSPGVRHRAEGEPYVEPKPLTVLAERSSPPLLEILRVVNKVSQNLHAEIALREVGFQATREGTAAAGIRELVLLLASLGVKEDDVDFRDGSGLSRLTLTTPETTIRLLRHLWNSSHRDAFVDTLPVAGEDGTLTNRFQIKRRGKQRYPAPSSVKAKTGTLSHVNALSGYIASKTFGPVAFSIMVNGSNTKSADIRAAIDRICLEVAR